MSDMRVMSDVSIFILPYEIFHVIYSGGATKSNTFDKAYFHGNSVDEVTREAVKLVQSNNYRYDDIVISDNVVGEYEEEYFLIKFGSIEEIVSVIPFSYKEIVDKHPEYFV